MDAWVYLFAKFTSEALFFESLFLFSLIAIYSAYMIVHRRKYGVAGKAVQSDLVKVYLGRLMHDAQDLREELFGILGDPAGLDTSMLEGDETEHHDSVSAAVAAIPSPTLDAAALEKLKNLEAKLSEQSKNLEALLTDKMKLEEELASAREKSSGEGGNSQPPDNSAWAEKVKNLEAQLAEYAVIEEDLANLKKLQKENKTLKTQIEELTAGTPVTDKSPQAALPTETPPAVEAVAASTISHTATEVAPVVAETSAEATSPLPPKTETVAPTPAAVAKDPFEAVVDSVEKSLEQPIAALPPEQAVKAEEAKLASDFDKLIAQGAAAPTK